MFAPEPFKWVCPKCGHSKIVTPKSDVIDPRDIMNICPKCGAEMERKELSGLIDSIKTFFQPIQK